MSYSSLLFDLLQVALGLQDSLRQVPTESQWAEVFRLSKLQGVSGIAYAGVLRLTETKAKGSETLTPESITFLQWTGWAQDLRERNAKVTRQGESIARHFREDGFWCRILKGQSMLSFYPADLADLREPGDIDIWVASERPDLLAQKGEGAIENSIRRVISYCCHLAKGSFVYYHHLDFPVLSGTECEVHYRPSSLNSPFRDRRLQKWFFAQYNDDCIYLLIFLLVHAYRHVCADAVRFKMLLDIYFVLQKVLEANSPDDYAKLLEAPLRSFGALPFAKAVMDVLSRTLGLEVPANARDMGRGQALLRGMLEYDGTEHGPHWYARMRQSIHSFRYYPHEAFWHVPFSMYHLWWQYKHRYKKTDEPHGQSVSKNIYLI